MDCPSSKEGNSSCSIVSKVIFFFLVFDAELCTVELFVVLGHLAVLSNNGLQLSSEVAMGAGGQSK